MRRVGDAPAPGGPDALSRRAFMGRALGLGASMAFGGVASSAARARAGPATTVRYSRLPTPSELRAQVAAMVDLGARLPGGSAHNEFVDRLEQGFASAGLLVSRDRFEFTKWVSGDFALDVLEGGGAGPVPLAGYYTNSGSTPAAGVTGPLAYLGAVPLPSVGGNPLDLVTTKSALERTRGEMAADLTAALAALPGGAAGRIVLVDAPIAPLMAGDLDPLLSYRYDPARTIRETDDYKRAWTTLLTLPPLSPFKSAGAAGVVFALDASAANAAGQYTPFINSYQGLPALIVDRDEGRRLRALARSLPGTRLTLEGPQSPHTPSDSLVATLPGRGSGDEVIVVNTHTDGMNAFEENAGIALVALARYFARRPLRRTLVFSAVTGHFGPGLPQTQGFIDSHPDLIERAVASLTVEHFGSREWLDDARGFHSTGRVEVGAIFHSQTPILKTGIESVRAQNLRRTELLRPAGTTFFGVGASLHAAGVPSLAFIAGPNYLLADAHHGHLDKLDPVRMRREIAWCVDALQRLDQVPARVLAAGDSTVLRG